MAIHVNKQEAEQKFSQLLQFVLKGEEIIISVEGQEMARLIPSSQIAAHTSAGVKSKRIPGIDQGKFVVPDDFDDPLPEDILKTFLG
jgi:antitoxin (DNA-binding transcriptional repressor) of toxin-antitoxin stability system